MSPSSILDEHLLQYVDPGQSGECELIIGLDFGTSASKVVIQAPELPGRPSFAVDFGELSHRSARYLLPTILWVAPNGTSQLSRLDIARSVKDIKLELLSGDEYLNSNLGPSRQGLNPEATAVAYLALLLRYTREWFLKTKRDVLKDFGKLNWSVNLGVPSPCIEENPENLRFQRVGKAAWMLSVLENQITLGKAQDELRYLIEAPEYWDRDDDGIACDLQIIPEIAAGAVGYALSTLRREGLHVMVDIGASTVDVCSFILHEREGNDRYSLLTTDVQLLGTIRLHHERILALMRIHEKQAENLRDKHDPLAPIAQDISPYLVSHEQLVSAARQAEDQLKERLQTVLRRVIWNAKMHRDPNSPVFRRNGRLPVLLIGGGSELPFFHSAVNELDGWLRTHTGNDGIVLPTEDPLLDTLTGNTAKYHRIAVAWGLSHRALDIGDITPADRIADIEPPRRKNWEDRFVGQEQV